MPGNPDRATGYRLTMAMTFGATNAPIASQTMAFISGRRTDGTDYTPFGGV